MSGEGVMVVSDRIALEFYCLSVLWLRLILEGKSERAGLVMTCQDDGGICHLHDHQLPSKLGIQRVNQLLLELLDVVDRQLPH